MDWGPLGVIVMGYPPLDYDDDKPHDEIVIGEVSSPWWKSQGTTLVLCRVNMINLLAPELFF